MDISQRHHSKGMHQESHKIKNIIYSECVIEIEKISKNIMQTSCDMRLEKHYKHNSQTI